MHTFMRRIHSHIIRAFIAVAAIAVTVSLTLMPAAALPPSGDGGEIVRPPAPPSCTDMFTCKLPREIQYTHRFLLSRKGGLPYTPEPRPLLPTVEVLRLNVVSQALGYLNLYQKYRTTAYRKEALDRVNYLYNLGDQALGNGPRDGMIGYTFLRAYQLVGDNRYRDAGLQQAERCLNGPQNDMTMNGGLMCALNLGAAYQLTGNLAYRDLSRAVVQRTAPKQFPDGALPHLPSRAGGENTSYTAWVGVELFNLRSGDPGDPNADIMLPKIVGFLLNRVNADGSINYQDADGTYYSDPGNADSRWWTNELPAIAYNLYAGGYTAKASAGLEYLFRWRMKADDLGGYPDKYANVDPNNIWEIGRPSVVRTSLIFWYLTMFASTPTCSLGPTVSCTVTPSDCNPLYAQLGLCDQGLTGVQTCLNGTYSSCFDPSQTAYRTGQACTVENYCQEEGSQACFYSCTHYGSKLCVGDTCGSQCYDIDDQAQGWPTCDVTCYDNQSCSTNAEPAWPNSGGGGICELPPRPVSSEF